GAVQRHQAWQLPRPREEGAGGRGGGRRGAGHPGGGRGDGVRSRPARRSAGSREPAPPERPRHLLHEELHGRHPLRSPPRRRDGGDPAQAAHRAPGRLRSLVPSDRKRSALMKINTRQRDGATILDLKGKITIGSGDLELRNAVQEALMSGAKNIIVNFAEVTTIDSSGVGELVSSYTTVKNRGAKLKLVNLHAKVRDVLHITQLIKVFDVYDTEDEAIRSF